MKEQYLIKICGTQLSDGEENSVELTTKGSYAIRGESYYISYKETEATGYEGCTTTVKLDASGKVTMLRFGAAASELVIEPGKRHICHYETGHGALTMGIAANEVIANLNEQGGELKFSYDLDINSNPFSRNIVNISVREVQ